MAFEATWRALRERGRAVDPDAVLVTPTSERPFQVGATADDRITIRYEDTGEERTLWRDQFAFLADRIEADADGLSVADLPSGVEPYVSVLSLAPGYVADESSRVVRRDETADAGESPYLRPAWEARAAPERVRDDAVLLADLLERFDADRLGSVAGDRLADLYVLLSDVQRGADRLRRSVGDRLLEYIGPDARLHGQFGTVHRTVRERRHLKDEATVLDAIDEHDIPRDWVLGVDPSKLDVVLAVTDLEADAVYDVDEQVYVQKTDVEEAEKHTRLQGLKDRLSGVDEREAEELRDEIEALEDRLEALLAAR